MFQVSSPLMHGGDIATWQQRMRDRGWDITVDGWYGNQSKGVCIGFQQDKHLQVDGVVGPQTWAAAWTAPVT
jgi:peptidoglycan hydrolase-like protein with peptidoglycan-binding domain